MGIGNVDWIKTVTGFQFVQFAEKLRYMTKLMTLIYTRCSVRGVEQEWTVMTLTRLNDLIRCEDAIKEICKRTCKPGVLCPDAYCKEVKEWITDDMVVDAVPVVHGEWILHHDVFGEPVAECSVCKVQGIILGNFCPNCGADMRKDGDNND